MARPPPSRVIYALLFYSLSMVLVFVARPRFAFREDGTPRPFGTASEDGTLYSVGVLAVVLAIASFFTFCLIDAME